MLLDHARVRRLALGLVAMTLLGTAGGPSFAAEPAPGAKPVAKADDKVSPKPTQPPAGKPGEAGADKSPTGGAASAPPVPGEGVGQKGADGDKTGAARPEGAASAVPGREKVKRPASPARKKLPQPAADEGVSASTPPLDINGLRAEVRREAPPAIGIDPPALPETRVEKMLADVAKARESLHDDTRKLEALLAAEGAGNAEGDAAAAGGKPAKNPLDILAKALRGIKPDQAAPIVSRLDRHLGAVVLQRMPPADAGKILGAMKPEIAAELATLIALHRPVADARGGEVKR